MLGKKVTLHAVDDVTLTLKEGEVLGLVGESGSGKSTLARTIVKLHRATSGKVAYRGEDISKQDRKSSKEFRRHVQMIFQDPYESLNPQANVFNAVLEPLIIHGMAKDRTKREAKVTELLVMVGLDPASKMDRFPHELSGGERQRVAIARALSLNPELLIADEPVSMLDVSIRLGVLNLMLELKERLKLTYLFITHDLGVARYIATRVAVMYSWKNCRDREFSRRTHSSSSASLHKATSLVQSRDQYYQSHHANPQNTHLTQLNHRKVADSIHAVQRQKKNVVQKNQH